MSLMQNLTNVRFGRWLVTGIAPRRNTNRSVYWYCRCDCGTVKEIAAGSLRKGQSTSCGCYRTEVNSTNPHYKSPTYNSWDNMIGRCYRSSQPDYDSYGGRGITVCQRWRDSFHNFLSDMGVRPEGMTLDRLKVDGNYEPGNCVWSTNKTQQNNKRNSIRIPLGDRTLTVEEFSAETGITEAIIRNRIYAKVPLNELQHGKPKRLSQPLQPHKRDVEREQARKYKAAVKAAILSAHVDHPLKSYEALAKEFGVSPATVRNYVLGIT